MLARLGVDTSMSYREAKIQFENAYYSDEDILESANINHTYMTNDPLDERDIKLFEKGLYNKDIYKSSLRLDNMLHQTPWIVRQHGDLLECFLQIAKPDYASISIDDGHANKIQSSASKELMPWLEEKNLPLWIMYGVKRNTNKALGMAGDGIDYGNCMTSIEKLCAAYPSNKIYLSVLEPAKNHQAVVLSRKFPNLIICGNWWFSNNASNIESNLQERFELLGERHMLYFSDARVIEQILYKTSFYKQCLANALRKRLETVSYQIIEKPNLLNKSLNWFDDYFKR